MESNDISKCPFLNGSTAQNIGGGGTKNRDWWPANFLFYMHPLSLCDLAI